MSDDKKEDILGGAVATALGAASAVAGWVSDETKEQREARWKAEDEARAEKERVQEARAAEHLSVARESLALWKEARQREEEFRAAVLKTSRWDRITQAVVADRRIGLFATLSDEEIREEVRRIARVVDEIEKL